MAFAPGGTRPGVDDPACPVPSQGMGWYLIRTKNGKHLNGGDPDWPFYFPTRASAEAWCVPGDTIEEAGPFRPLESFVVGLGKAPPGGAGSAQEG